MALTVTDIRTEDYIFKDNSTYLSQENWIKFFDDSIPQGFFSHCGKYDASANKYKINPFSGINNGLHFSSEIYETLDPVTQAEVDCLYCLEYDSSDALKLVKVTGIKQSADDALGFLSDLLEAYSHSWIDLANLIHSKTGLNYYTLPLAYAIYGHGYYDLVNVISARRSYFSVNIEPDSSDTAVATPYCGYTDQPGLIQVYGKHRYDVNIDASYTLGEFRLYPVPAVSMDPAEIYIKNNTSGSITVKLPLSYRDMYFEYMTDSNWTESSGFKCYTLRTGEDMFIKMTQATQDVYSSGGVNYPKSVYEISRGMEDVVFNDVYSKSEADDLFETQTAAATALAAKADVSDVYSKSETDNLLAEKADASDVYTKSEVDDMIEDIPVISTVYTKTETNELLAAKADASDVYSKSEDDTLLDAKANSADVYSKAEADTLLSAKANSADVYSKSQTDNLLSEKVDSDDVYSKAEADAKFANLTSPTFTGTPKAPTAGSGTNTTQIATTAFVQSAIANKANSNSPAFTGAPTAPTQDADDISTKLATTAFVSNALASNGFMPNIYVDGTYGNDTTGSGTQSNPYKTIQKAIDRASYQAKILLTPGVYYGSVVISGKQIVMCGTSNTEIRITNLAGTAISVIKDAYLQLEGTFTVTGKSIAISIANNSTVVYVPLSSPDKLSLYAGDPNIVYNETNVLKLSGGSAFYSLYNYSLPSKVYLDINPSQDRGYAISATGGSFVYIQELEVEIYAPTSNYVLQCAGSQIYVKTISGGYDSSHIWIDSNDITSTVIFGNILSSSPYARLHSPALTGTPTAPTAAKATDNTQIATTAFVHDVAEDYAPLHSPALTGTPTAPTAANGTNTTQIATTAFVQAALASTDTIDVYVDQWAGSDSTGTGTSDNPYATIQKAVDSVPNFMTGTIHIFPLHTGDNVYYEAVTIKAKTIKLVGTTSNLVQIHTDDNNSSTEAAINVLDGANLELYGSFELEGVYTGLRIRNNSSVIYRIREGGDNLSVRARGTTQNVRHNGIEVSYGSKFIAGPITSSLYAYEVDIYTYPTTVQSSGILATYGSIVAAEKVVMDMSDQRQDQIAIENTMSIVMMEQLLGTYGTAYSGTLGFKNIGNVS